MKKISRLSSIVLLGLLLAGCASHSPAPPQPADSRIEAPVQSGSDVEIHGQISTSVGTSFK